MKKNMSVVRVPRDRGAVWINGDIIELNGVKPGRVFINRIAWKRAWALVYI